MAVKYQAIQKTSGHARDSSVESMEQVEAKKLMKVLNFGIEASTGHLRSPACNNQPKKQQEMAQKSEATLKQNSATKETWENTRQASGDRAPVNMLAIYKANTSAPGSPARFSVLILKDAGSTHNLITHELAASVMLPSSLTALSLMVPGHQREERNTCTYTAKLTDQHGASNAVQAIGLDNITVVAPAPEVEQLVKLIPGADQ